MKKKVLLLSLPAFMLASTINFDQALKETLANNKELKAKKLMIKKAQLDLKGAKSYDFGTLKLQENIARTNNALNVFGMKLMDREAKMKDFGFTAIPPAGTQVGEMAPDSLNNPEARTNYETKLTYEVPLFTGFKLKNAKAMAALQVKANEAKYKHDEKQLGLDVLKAYNGAVAAKYFIDATKKAKEATSSFVNFATEMYKEGLITNIDVKQAQVYDMKIHSQILEAQNKYSLAIAYLKFLTNNKTITDVADFKTINISSISLEQLQNEAITKRDDLTWMKQNTKTMQKKIEFEKSANFPMIGAHLEYGFEDDKFNNIDNKKDYYTAAVGLEYTIFTGFKISSDIQKAKIEYAKTKHYLDYMTEGIRLQVEKAYLTLKTKQSVLKEKLKAQSLAEEVLVQAEEMYKNQLMKMSDLLMQQAQAQKARAEAILAKYEATIAAAQLQLALGQKLN